MDTQGVVFAFIRIAVVGTNNPFQLRFNPFQYLAQGFSERNRHFR